MAITPRSRGLGNIGSIVNRQGMASPTRPMPKPVMAKMPVPKPVAPKPMASPVIGGRTTMAQRQAMTPFKNYSKPAMSKVDPMQQAMQPQQGMSPMMQPAPQPFNPQPNPGQSQIMPMNMFGDYGQQALQAGQQGLGQMFGNMNMFNGLNTGGMFSGLGGNNMNYNDLNLQMQPMDMFNGNQPGNFGNPNPMASDYDELESSKFNTNPSMSGSMFGGGGFSGY